MPDTGETDAETLEALRARIDAIDEAMHRLLIERGTVIESLISIKGTGKPGSAFRPAREADMMRRLAARHTGPLPLATVEHIWREIITTFTRMQAPFNVAVDVSVEPARMRDLARFVFGFSVDLVDLEGAVAAVRRVAEANDLALVARKAPGPWWRELIGPSAPRIMALLPFVRAEGRPADLPAFVVSPPLTDPASADITVFAVTVRGPFHRVEDAEIVASAVEGDATELLLATTLDQPTLATRLRAADVDASAVVAVGGFARGITVGGASTLLYEAVGAPEAGS